MNKSSIITKVTSNPETAMGEEIALLNISTGKYLVLNSVASDIWGYIKDETTFGDLLKIMMSNYDVEEEMCVRDIKECLENMKKEELVTISV